MGIAAGHTFEVEGVVGGVCEVAAPEGDVEVGKTVANAGTEKEVEGLLHTVGLRPVDGTGTGEGEAY